MTKKIVILTGKFAKNKTELTRELMANHFEVVYADGPELLLQCLENQSKATVVLESNNTSEWSAINVLKHVHAVYRSIPIILIVEDSCESLAISAIKAGVYDYFKLPMDLDGFISSLNRLYSSDISDGNEQLRMINHGKTAIHPKQEIVGISDHIGHIRRLAEKAAKTNSNVLITGETGTGKELVAKLIHGSSTRCDLPNVCVNCAAIPESLLESELFGYERGAFTGAVNNRDGILMRANKGTLFLDEIGEMSGYAQAKILRAIETKIVQKVGGKHATPVDIRVIAATNQKLEELVEAKQFRKDLFFRLNVARIHLPALRERTNDILPLCAHFISQFNRQFKQNITKIQDEVLSLFLQYSWPGNVRELKNIMEAIFINQPVKEIQVADLPEYYHEVLTRKSHRPVHQSMRGSARDAIQHSTSSVTSNSSHAEERDKVLVALLSTNWNKSKAAQKLNWSRMTLYRKMQKYNIKEVEPKRDDSMINDSVTP